MQNKTHPRRSDWFGWSTGDIGPANQSLGPRAPGSGGLNLLDVAKHGVKTAARWEEALATAATGRTSEQKPSPSRVRRKL